MNMFRIDDNTVLLKKKKSLEIYMCYFILPELYLSCGLGGEGAAVGCLGFFPL